MRLLDIRNTKRPRCNSNKIVSLAVMLLLALCCHSAHARPAQNNRTSKSRDPDDYYNILGLKRSAKPKDIKVRRMSTECCCMVSPVFLVVPFGHG